MEDRNTGNENPAASNEPRPPAAASTGASPSEPGAELTPEQEKIRDRVVEVLKTVFDPEIPVNIYELGMIYDVGVGAKADVSIRMTLTSPMCPVAGTLPGEVEAKVKGLEEVEDCRVDLVWDPPWNPSMMSESARLQLNL